MPDGTIKTVNTNPPANNVAPYPTPSTNNSNFCDPEPLHLQLSFLRKLSVSQS